MKELEKNHSEYLQVKSQVNELNQSISGKEAEICELKKVTDEVQGGVNELTVRLSTAPQDMAQGRLSTNDFLALKQALIDKEGELNSLNGAVCAQQSALELLRNNLVEESRWLRRRKGKLVADVTEQITCEIAEAVSEPLKNMACALLASQQIKDKQDDIYKTIGVELCKKVFGERSKFKAQLPPITEARLRVDELIGKLS